MSACVMEEGREDGGGARADEDGPPERTRRDVLLSGRGRRACSEQGPHPSLHPQHSTATAHLWGQGGGGRRGWSRKRTSAPQMSNPHGSTPRVALVLRSRRSWPVAPQSYRRYEIFSTLYFFYLSKTKVDGRAKSPFYINVLVSFLSGY
ncbi:uncharacterized protein LOC133519764 [Cydia pomonella]|uniref:uncharacterized protein LOC133519764 n=1 Tax=Cydia pomonella TaxID=82600 RepID=UPI002ADE7A41|nr:uncharacterized protein LOC133519764 [Cydia pomonella]